MLLERALPRNNKGMRVAFIDHASSHVGVLLAHRRGCFECVAALQMLGHLCTHSLHLHYLVSNLVCKNSPRQWMMGALPCELKKRWKCWGRHEIVVSIGNLCLFCFFVSGMLRYPLLSICDYIAPSGHGCESVHWHGSKEHVDQIRTRGPQNQLFLLPENV